MAESFKKILKKVFPLVLLRNIAFKVNVLKTKTIDKFLFPEEEVVNGRFLLKRELNPFAALNINLSYLSDELAKDFSIWNNPDWTQDEYILVYKSKVIIEPKYGWALSGAEKLIYPSLGFSRAPYLKKPDYWSLKRRKNVKKINTSIVSFRDTGEENYFHFFNDVLPKLFLLEAQNLVSPEMPLVISATLYQKPFFRYFLENTRINKFNWITQSEEEYIEAESAIFCKPLTHTKKYYLEALNLLPLKQEYLHRQRRVFVTRSKSTLRYIENWEEIEKLVKGYGFEIIDAATLNFKEQITLFAQTELLIAVHGAGLTNMMYRCGGQMKVLELFSPMPYLPFHYIMLASMFNFQYNAVKGEPGKEVLSGGFIIDRQDLQDKIKQMI